ncbi:unnamed protein product [Oikopleura dioica]|uniref:Uncharacterized protein n=1 Tax=Oikopleura dioica TaxID=34765 RepID=E4XCL0_OIKDI|nr:unnamed protein product [Oikopleura dioica]
MRDLWSTTWTRAQPAATADASVMRQNGSSKSGNHRVDGDASFCFILLKAVVASELQANHCVTMVQSLPPTT